MPNAVADGKPATPHGRRSYGTAAQAALIRQRREELGMSREELAEKTGVSRSYIWQVESRLRRFQQDETIEAVARALDLDMNAIYIAGGVVPPGVQREIDEMDADQLAQLRIEGAGAEHG